MKKIILSVVCLIVVIMVVSSIIFSGMIIHSHRQPVLKTPKDYGMQYEDVEFKSSDGLTIRGWLIPGKSDTLVVQDHPMFFNRTGFLPEYQGWLPLFKTKVDLLANAKVLNDAGHSVLMFDLRNSGESDSGLSGVGLTEYQDVAGAMHYVNSRKDLSGKKIAFLGICMGANSMIVAMSKAPDEMRSIRCLIAVQPVSARVFIESYLKNVFTPVSLTIVPIVNLFTQLRGGFPLDEMSPIPYVKDIKIPILYIQAETDPWTDLNDIKTMDEKTASKTNELYFIKGQMGRFDTYNWIHEHPELIAGFLKKNM